MTTISTSTALDRPITAWLARQRALGRHYDNEERVLASLQRFVARVPVRDLDRGSFDLWCDTLRHLDANTRRARQRIVRKFCLYTGTGLSGGIHALFKIARVHDSEGQRPRIHDLRHSFAVQALLRWYRDGADVQSNLPRLAMYMGHVSIISTAHYLHFVPALAELASDRFEKSFGNLIEEMPR